MAETVTGVTPFARAWLHVGTVRVGGQKMAKSTGNLVLVRDVLQTTRPAVLRLALLDRPWAQPWDFGDDVLAAAERRLEALYSAAGHPGEASAVGHRRSRRRAAGRPRRPRARSTPCSTARRPAAPPGCWCGCSACPTDRRLASERRRAASSSTRNSVSCSSAKRR